MNRFGFIAKSHQNVLSKYAGVSTASKMFNSTVCSQYVTHPDKLKSEYDVIIVGAGHNGLVAANYLAKYSKKKLSICILEKRHVLGGAAITEEIVPGFKFSRASYLLSLFRPKIIAELDLMRHGILKFYTRNPSSYTPLLESDSQYAPNSRSLTLGLDAEANARQIAQFSEHDAQQYVKYEHWLNEICSQMEYLMDVAPPSAQGFNRSKSLLAKIQYAKSYLNMSRMKFFAKHSTDIYRLFTESAANILDEWFDSQVLKASLATDSVIGAMLSPYSTGSSYVLLHHVIGEIEGKKGVWAYVEGGMGSISNCLAANAKSFGDTIDIFTSQDVASIELDNDKNDQLKTKGVLLSNGKFIKSSRVLSNCTPHVTFNDLLGKYNLQQSKVEETRNFFKRINNIDYESGTMKINLAVNKLPNFKADPSTSESPMPHHQCTIHINSENIALIDQAYQETKQFKRPSKKPMIEMVIPSTLDPTLAPKGSHVILLFCQYFPYNKDESAETRQQYAQIVYNQIENYAPGFKASIVGEDILTPYQLERTFGLTGGNIFHGALPLHQLFISRPVINWSDYSTPIRNLYLAGSGAHPGGGVMGSPGRLAALACLQEM